MQKEIFEFRTINAKNKAITIEISLVSWKNRHIKQISEEREYEPFEIYQKILELRSIRNKNYE